MTKKKLEKVRPRIKVGNNYIKDAEATWLNESTNLSFADWLYINHNIFSYNVSDKNALEQAMTAYNSLPVSDPYGKNYIHFIKWGYLTNAFKFTDIITGRTSQNVIDMYREYIGDEEIEVEDDVDEADPETFVDEYHRSVLNWEDVPFKERSALAFEYSKSGMAAVLALSDWLLVYKNIASINTDTDYIQEYNESSFSHEDSRTYLSFPAWLHRIKRVTRTLKHEQHKTYPELADLWESLYGTGNPEPRVEKVELIEMTDLKGRERPTMEQIDEVVKLLELQLEQYPSASCESKLRMALNYRARLLDKSGAMVYNGGV